jgi:hypothetical protein
LTKPELRNTQIGQLCVELTNREKLTNGELTMQAIGQFFKLVNGLQQLWSGLNQRVNDEFVCQ